MAAVELAEKKAEEAKKCFLCSNPCTEDDYCNGCGKYICQSCDVHQPVGEHEPHEHKSDKGW